MHIQTDRSAGPARHSHNSPPRSALPVRENQRDNDTDRYELLAQSRQVAGAADRKGRARSPSRKPACPPTFSQKAAIPDQPNLRTAPDGPSTQQFHAAIWDSAADGRVYAGGRSQEVPRSLAAFCAVRKRERPGRDIDGRRVYDGVVSTAADKLRERALVPRYTVQQAASVIGRRPQRVRRWAFGYDRLYRALTHEPPRASHALDLSRQRVPPGH
jgi:hypothetical protein